MLSQTGRGLHRLLYDRERQYDHAKANPHPVSHSFYARLARPFVRIVARSHLTALCYHRVVRASDAGFQGYKPTINASEEAFAQQMDYLRTNYDPISLKDLAASVETGCRLPARPVLVTFDDGYRDNAEVAWPIMRERGVPAVIFLATDYIGTGRPFIWDLAAYLFSIVPETHADVPLIGPKRLATVSERECATAEWVNAMKRLPGAKRTEAIVNLSVALGVDLPDQAVFRRLYMDWSEVKTLALQGVEFGGHTCSHPILTSIPDDEGRREIEESIKHVTEVLGRETLGFAYPNGSSKDFSEAHEDAVMRSGVPLAFSLEPGPMKLSEISKHRTSIRRVYVGAQETMPRFVAKLMGASRLAHSLRSLGVPGKNAGALVKQ